MPRSREEIDALIADTDRWLSTLDPTKFRDATPLRRVGEISRSIDEQTAQLQIAVFDARQAGFSWASIGVALGVTGHEAQERFDRQTP